MAASLLLSPAFAKSVDDRRQHCMEFYVMEFPLANARPVDQLLEDLVEELQVPPGRYD